MFARYDRDRSGSITFDEFCVAVADIKLSRYAAQPISSKRCPRPSSD